MSWMDCRRDSASARMAFQRRFAVATASAVFRT